jgi:hypothetical protein
VALLWLDYLALLGLIVSLARPTRRRARMILAPAAVAIRTRKPWVVALFCLLGRTIHDFLRFATNLG